MAFHLSLSECKLVVLGASHDNGYGTLLRSLRTDGKMSRIGLLKGYECVAQELKEFEEWMAEIPWLFMAQKLGDANRSSRSVSPVSPTKSPRPTTFSAAAKTANGSGASWQVVSFKASKKAQINTIKDLDPRPCYGHYLREGCTKDTCKYGHDYDLSKNAMGELRKFAKRISCDYWIHDMCPYTAETCINGHVCHNGQLCPFRGNTCFFQKWHDENPARLK
ncbi:hypothetical protein DACRYDRAFT_100580 [Dacryopinax primogenitus]|uniref:C3H1-type domain-containing protein n=1 Tax=Dacryopinax primogenitus (strain DJM 731) TaxID=1858805 RepID=M5FX86_DACPD|nr:uncharacterized protein DACRYDRAFT_100580 [Dacryopinax primogenitus]EJU01054.1 hypothetical protein DACRYDRAFT_100580 [Dacryopinax primogenitus]